MLLLELTEVERRNLLAFLKRVSLTGEEAETFLLLKQKISAAQPKKEPEQPLE